MFTQPAYLCDMLYPCNLSNLNKPRFCSTVFIFLD